MVVRDELDISDDEFFDAMSDKIMERQKEERLHNFQQARKNKENN